MELYSDGNKHQRPRFTKREHTIYNQRSRSTVSVFGNVHWTRNDQRNNSIKTNHGFLRNRFNFSLYSVIASLLFATPAYAETPVTAIANPQATSSGSVTNQAVQVLQGPYVTNSYGGGVTCQGPTFNLTPFVTGTRSGQTPYEPFYNGEPTGQKDNWANNFGISATLSFPLDGGLQERCKSAAENWAIRQQAEADKARLDFELVRLMRCGEAMKAGVHFHPDSPYASVCSDVVVVVPTPPPVVVSPPPPPKPKPSESSYQAPSRT